MLLQSHLFVAIFVIVGLFWNILSATEAQYQLKWIRASSPFLHGYIVNCINIYMVHFPK